MVPAIRFAHPAGYLQRDIDMAHNLKQWDSMMAVGDRPWHGLGVTLDEAPKTASEALSLAKCDWTVEKRPMFLADGSPVRVTGSVSKKNEGLPGAIVRVDTNEILGVVGPSYTPLQNSVVADLYQPLIDDGVVDIESCGSLFNGRRVWMLGRLKNGQQPIAGSSDAVQRYLMLAHGHDGQMAVRFGFTFVRVVCWNTMSLAVNSKQQGRLVKCLHTTNLQSNLETLRSALNASDEVFDLTAEEYRKLASRGVTRASLREYARVIVDADQDEKKWSGSQRNKIDRIVNMAISGRGNTGKTWWDAYNGATEYLTWAAQKRADTRFNSLWFGDNATKNQDALDLAVAMAT